MKVISLAIMAVAVALAQPQKYDVVSVKSLGNAPPTQSMISTGVNDGGRFRAVGISMQVLVQFAYRVQDYQIANAPGWFSGELFEIEAKPETPFTPTPEQAQIMVQAILADRFGLKVRHETRDGSVYNLVVAKGGPKIKRNTDAPPPADPAAPRPAGAAVLASGVMPRGGMMMGIGRVRATGVKLDLLLQPLMQQLGRPVINKTGLEGEYDIELHWTPEQAQVPPGAVPNGVPLPDPTGPTLFTAIEEQLGLKLDSARGPVDTLVIEAAQKPSAN